MNNKVEIDVNGISVDIDAALEVRLESIPLYTLLRKGDHCLVDDNGIIREGRVENIIRLSNGKMLFSVTIFNHFLKDWDLVYGDKVTPVDALQCKLRLTAYDMILRKYEPKGQSTNVSLWGTER